MGHHQAQVHVASITTEAIHRWPHHVQTTVYSQPTDIRSTNGVLQPIINITRKNLYFYSIQVKRKNKIDIQFENFKLKTKKQDWYSILQIIYTKSKFVLKTKKLSIS